jgi:hypothetical protein
MKKKISVLLVAFITVVALVLPDVSFARGFGGMSSSRSSSSSRSYSSPSRSYSSSSSSRSSSFSGGSSSRSSSTRSSSGSSKSSGWSFFGGSSSKSKSTSTKPKTKTSTSSSYNSAYKSSAKKTISSTKTTGSFSGKSSTKSPTYHSGRVYSSTPTRAYYGGHYVSVNHYYHVGYSPFGWGGYYSGFSTGMFMGSLYHPFGHVYPVNGVYTSYGASPLAIIVDIIALLLFILIVYGNLQSYTSRKTTFRRKF